MALAWLDACLWSSAWLGLAAAALTAAAARALGLAPAPALLGLAFGGTLAVYVIDRVRDLPRDRVTAPERAAFVARHRRALLALAGLGARRRRRRFARARPAAAPARGGRGRARPRAPPAQALRRREAALSHLRLDRGAGGPARRRRSRRAARRLGRDDRRRRRCSRTWCSRTCATGRRSPDGSARSARCRWPAASRSAGSPPRSRGPPRCGRSRRCRSRWPPRVLGFRPTERYGALCVDGALLAGALLALAWPAA